MRVLLINVPIRLGQPPNAFPTGLGIVAQCLLNAGHEVEILDANAHRYDGDQVLELAKAAKAEVIGISAMVSTYSYLTWLVNELDAALPDTTIVLGGGAATAVPELLMERTAADILVRREGEHTMVEIADRLQSGQTMHGVLGTVFRDGDQIVVEPERPAEPDLDVFPMPAYHLFPVELYLANPIWNFEGKTMNIIASRGCPMDCKFCYAIFGLRSYRRRGANAIMEEIRFLKREYDIDAIAFVDDNLTVKKDHLRQVCEKLREENIPWGCHGRVDTADHERLAMMKRAGCKWLGFGIESGSQKILNAMRKRVTVEKARSAILRARQYGIFANTTFIHGYPGEDLETVKETLLFKLELRLPMNSFFATPYPGTELYSEAVERGLIPDLHEYLMSLDNAYDFRVNLTEMSDEELLDLRSTTFVQLMIALRVVEPSFRTTEQTALVELALRLLKQSALVPEIHGVIFLGLSRALAAQGEASRARELDRLARESGVTTDNRGRLVFTNRRQAKERVSLPIAG